MDKPITFELLCDLKLSDIQLGWFALLCAEKIASCIKDEKVINVLQMARKYLTEEIIKQELISVFNTVFDVNRDSFFYCAARSAIETICYPQLAECYANFTAGYAVVGAKYSMGVYDPIIVETKQKQILLNVLEGKYHD